LFASAPVLALITAFCIGTADFSTHYGLRHVKPMQGSFFGVCIQWLTTLLIILVLGVPWEIEDWRGPIFFFLAGILHPGIFYVLLLISVQRLGPSRAITLKGTSPFWGVAIAVFFLGERPNFSIFAGLLLVGFGVMYLTSERNNKLGISKNLLWPLAAAFFSGLGPNLTKVALRYLDDPLLGVIFGVGGGIFALFVANSLVSGREGGRFWIRAVSPKKILLFLPLGIFSSAGFIMYYSALQVGDVTVVIPLVQTAPFFAIVLSRLLIQKREGVNFRLLVSAVAVVLGAFFITMGRA
jgi:drug/metabolite transporter (DMT)-like permease